MARMTVDVVLAAIKTELDAQAADRDSTLILDDIDGDNYFYIEGTVDLRALARAIAEAVSSS